MKLNAYLRVSTDEQVRNGGGLDIQRDQILAWAEANDHEIVRIITDAGITGTDMVRPGIMELYDSLDDVDGVVAQADTRYSRTLAGQEAFYARLWSEGKRIFTVQVGEILENDPDDPMRAAMRQMRGVMSELEAGLIRKRLRDGKRKAREMGKWGGGTVPYGWIQSGNELIPSRPEQLVLESIKRMRHEEGMTLHAIAKALNDQGLRGRRKGLWTETRVLRTLPPGVHPIDRKLHPNWLQPEKNGDTDGIIE